MVKGFCLLGCVMLLGCATVKIVQIRDSTYKDGLRFYRPDPYLLVANDDEGKLKTDLIYLPNRQKEYALRSTIGIGSVQINATLEGGWNLTTIGSTIDSKVPETITALTGALQAAAGVSFARGIQAMEPGLYRIEFDKAQGFVSRIVGPINIVGP